MLHWVQIKSCGVFFKFGCWTKKSIIFTALPEEQYQTVLFWLSFSHHGKGLINPKKKKWWFSITPRPSLEVFWQGWETPFPACSLSAQRWTVDVTIFQLQLKGFPSTAQLRWPHTQEGACGGGHLEEWMVRAALRSGWAGSPQTRVQGSQLLLLGRP